MDEYIKREEAIKIAESYKPQNGSSFCRNRGIADYIAEDISMIPYADVAPVRHGHWIKTGSYAFGENEYLCSECKETEWRTSASRLKYCPFCGAKMGLEG